MELLQSKKNNYNNNKDSVENLRVSKYCIFKVGIFFLCAS